MEKDINYIRQFKESLLEIADPTALELTRAPPNPFLPITTATYASAFMPYLEIRALVL